MFKKIQLCLVFLFVPLQALKVIPLITKTFPLIKRKIIDKAIHLKVTNNSCAFGHNEDTKTPNYNDKYKSTLLNSKIKTFPPVENLKLSDGIKTRPFLLQLSKLKDLGFNEMHLVGGEPSCHPQLAEIIHILTKDGFSVRSEIHGF